MFDFKIKKYYSFEVYSPSTLGANFINLLYLGSMDYTLVQSMDDLHARHLGALAGLPEGTIREPERLEYLVFKFPDGSTRPIARVWIRENTVQELTGLTVHVTVPNASPQDADWIREQLSQRGYRNFTIELK